MLARYLRDHYRPIRYQGTADPSVLLGRSLLAATQMPAILRHLAGQYPAGVLGPYRRLLHPTQAQPGDVMGFLSQFLGRQGQGMPGYEHNAQLQALLTHLLSPDPYVQGVFTPGGIASEADRRSQAQLSDPHGAVHEYIQHLLRPGGVEATGQHGVGPEQMRDLVSQAFGSGDLDAMSLAMHHGFHNVAGHPMEEMLLRDVLRKTMGPAIHTNLAYRLGGTPILPPEFVQYDQGAPSAADAPQIRPR
jgi:hypothetical protein